MWEARRSCAVNVASVKIGEIFVEANVPVAHDVESAGGNSDKFDKSCFDNARGDESSLLPLPAGMMMTFIRVPMKCVPIGSPDSSHATTIHATFESFGSGYTDRARR